jgi:hypothetical protein
MSNVRIRLSYCYSGRVFKEIIDAAALGQCIIYYHNQLSQAPEPLTRIQLAGISRYGRICILLETGQTYQVGMGLPEDSGTYQEVGHDDLLVNEATLEKLTAQFGKGDLKI